MTVHVIALPHLDPIRSNSWCAYSQKLLRFGGLLRSQGIRAILYAGPENDGDYDEHVPIVSVEDRQNWYPDADWHEQVFNQWNPDDLPWTTMADRAIEAIRERIEPGDFIGITAGRCQARIADAFPEATISEWAVGYPGVLDKSYRVWESAAWRAHVAGLRNDDTVRLFDATVPNFYDIADFPEGTGQGGYYLFVGRLMSRKGPHIAAEACKRMGAKLIVAGQGVASAEPGKITCTDGTVLEGDVEYAGVVGPEERAKLMGDATALFCPTLYLEPFGGVSVEAQLCGTPALTTPSGGLPENIREGRSGYVCQTLAEFAGAASVAGSLDRKAIRQYAQATWGTEAIAPKFEHYFARLETLQNGGAGWYA